MALNLCSNQAASFKMKEVKYKDGMFSKGKLVSWTVRNDFEVAGVCRTCIKHNSCERLLEKLLNNCWDEDNSETGGVEAVILTRKKLMLHLSVVKARRKTWEEEV